MSIYALPLLVSVDGVNKYELRLHSDDNGDDDDDCDGDHDLKDEYDQKWQVENLTIQIRTQKGTFLIKPHYYYYYYHSCP